MAFPSINDGWTQGSTNSVTTCPVTTPDHSAGDVIYILAARDGAGALTLADFTALYDSISIAGTAVFSLWYKTAGDAEPEIYNIASALSERHVWIALSVSNDGGINVQAVTGSGVIDIASIPTLTTTVDECLVLSVVATDLVSNPISTPADNSELTEISIASGATLALFYRHMTTAGATGVRTANLDTAEEWITPSFAIAPGEFVPPEPPPTPPPAAALSVQRIRTYLPG